MPIAEPASLLPANVKESNMNHVIRRRVTRLTLTDLFLLHLSITKSYLLLCHYVFRQITNLESNSEPDSEFQIWTLKFRNLDSVKKSDFGTPLLSNAALAFGFALMNKHFVDNYSCFLYIIIHYHSTRANL